eukprot:403350501
MKSKSPNQLQVGLLIPSSQTSLNNSRYQNSQKQLSLADSELRNQKSIKQSKPPKPQQQFDTILTHRRDQTIFSLETQSILSDNINYNNTTQMSGSVSLRSITQPQPFNLSRSNSRRNKDVLVKEKIEKEQKELDDIEQRAKNFQKQLKNKEIPMSNYIPDMQAYRSTKNLTSFKDFNFNSTTSMQGSSSILSLSNANYNSSAQRSRDPSSEGVAHKTNNTTKYSGGLRKNVIELYAQENSLRLPQTQGLKAKVNRNTQQYKSQVQTANYSSVKSHDKNDFIKIDGDTSVFSQQQCFSNIINSEDLLRESSFIQQVIDEVEQEEVDPLAQSQAHQIKWAIREQEIMISHRDMLEIEDL